MAEMPTPGAQRRSLTQPAPLAELTVLKVRRLGPCVALPARALSRAGTVRWHRPLHRVSSLGIDTHPPHPLKRLPDKLRVRCLHATELQQQPHCVPALARVRSGYSSASRHPVSSSARAYKRRPPPLHLFHAKSLVRR
jgi:hypothetical protein